MPTVAAAAALPTSCRCHRAAAALPAAALPPMTPRCRRAAKLAAAAALTLPPPRFRLHCRRAAAKLPSPPLSLQICSAFGGEGAPSFLLLSLSPPIILSGVMVAHLFLFSFNFNSYVCFYVGSVCTVLLS
jgi:hypothetical protein